MELIEEKWRRNLLEVCTQILTITAIHCDIIYAEMLCKVHCTDRVQCISAKNTILQQYMQHDNAMIAH